MVSQIGDERAHRRSIGRMAMVAALFIGFKELGVKTMHAFVHKDNLAAYTVYLSIGFEVLGNCGEENNELEITID